MLFYTNSTPFYIHTNNVQVFQKAESALKISMSFLNRDRANLPRVVPILVDVLPK